MITLIKSGGGNVIQVLENGLWVDISLSGLTDEVRELSSNGANQFFAINSSGGWGRILYSTNGGKYWNLGWTPSGILFRKCFYLNGTYVMFGVNGNLYYSSNVAQDYAWSSGSLILSTNPIYVDSDGTHAIIADTGNLQTRIYTSGNPANSSSWNTYSYASLGITDVRVVKYVNGQYFLLAGVSNSAPDSGLIYKLNVGLGAWELATYTLSCMAFSVFPTDMNYIASANMYVICGVSAGEKVLAISSDFSYVVYVSTIPNNALDLFNDSLNLYVSTNSGVYQSTDAVNWNFFTDNTSSGLSITGIPHSFVCFTPEYNPSQGTLYSPSNVYIYSNVGSTIHYTLDGTDPHSSGTVQTMVSGSFVAVSESTTIRSYATLMGYTNSSDSQSIYTFPLKADPPSFNPIPDTYVYTQNVTVSSQPNTYIVYTTDGTDPHMSMSANWVVPNSVIVISSDTYIRAYTYGGMAGFIDSEEVQAQYYITGIIPTVDTPTFLPIAGQYGSFQNVEILCPSATSIFYTTDESIPTSLSTPYTVPISVSVTTTIEAIGMRSGYLNSAVAIGLYEILYCENPVFSVLSGTYNLEQTLTLTCATGGSIIYFTNDGSIPTTLSTPYTVLISIDGTQTIKAFAVASGYIDSNVVEETYTFQCANLSFSPIAGTYTSSQTIQILCSTPLVDIYYTDDGSIPTSLSNLYTAPFLLSETKTIKAIASKTNYNDSNVLTGVFTINLPQVNTPTFNPVSGVYTGSQTVSILCGTSGVDIFYTTDGSTPTVFSTQYTVPFIVSENIVVKAIATKLDFIDSHVGIATYNIQALEPVLSPSGGKYTSARVSISCLTPNSTVFYTVDGSTPNSHSLEYITAIELTPNAITEVKAIAIAPYFTNSNVTTESYLIEGPKLAAKYIEPSPLGISKPLQPPV